MGSSRGKSQAADSQSNNASWADGLNLRQKAAESPLSSANCRKRATRTWSAIRIEGITIPTLAVHGGVHPPHRCNSPRRSETPPKMPRRRPSSGWSLRWRLPRREGTPNNATSKDCSRRHAYLGKVAACSCWSRRHRDNVPTCIVSNAVGWCRSTNSSIIRTKCLA